MTNHPWYDGYIEGLDDCFQRLKQIEADPKIIEGLAEALGLSNEARRMLHLKEKDHD